MREPFVRARHARTGKPMSGRDSGEGESRRIGGPARTGPLAGIRIVDLTSVVSGPLATMMLADQGADVIKIENPNGGDFTRQVSNRSGGVTANFLNNNRSKRSVTVDLKDPRGLEVVKRLVAGADAFAQNFRPGVVERMGLGYEALAAVNPRLVYLSISGFGDTGPYRDKPVYDPLVQAISGLTTVQGGSDDARPRLVRTIVPDKVSGMMAAQALTAGLLAQARTGRGQHVKISMLEAVIDFLWHSDMGSQTFVGADIPQQAAQSFIDLIYDTLDGFITVSVMTDRQWVGLSRAVERPDLLTDPRFLTASLRQENIDARLAVTQESLEGFTTEEALDRLEMQDVPCAPVLTRWQMTRHPQVEAMGIVAELDHPAAGKVRQARPAARFSDGPLDIATGAPALGAHTDAVLAEAGFADEEIAALREAGVVGGPREEQTA